MIWEVGSPAHSFFNVNQLKKCPHTRHAGSSAYTVHSPIRLYHPDYIKPKPLLFGGSE